MGPMQLRKRPSRFRLTNVPDTGVVATPTAPRSGACTAAFVVAAIRYSAAPFRIVASCSADSSTSVGVTVVKGRVYVLHCFKKKSGKASQKDVNTADERLKEVIKRESKK